MRIGNGYDVHRFEKNRKLVLGGVLIPYDLGLLGHSDADVLLHAICDALLGAAALGDIGKHFPDSSEEYKDIDSRILLRKAKELLSEKGYYIENVDSIIVCQAPKLAPFIEKMRENIAEDLGVSLNSVSVKATTEERLGFTGRKEGIAAYAVCLIDKK